MTAQPRGHVTGAGSIVEVPGVCGGGETAYLVVPASHCGRVVTGVVFLCERPPSSAATITATGDAQFLAEDPQVIERYGLASISFADKLAEQGYKVLVLCTPSAMAGGDAADGFAPVAERLEAAAAYLRQHHDTQRVGLFGFGHGADVAIKMALERRPRRFECHVAMSPEGQLPWSTATTTATSDRPKADDDDLLAPALLVLAGGRTAYARSETHRRLVEALDAPSTTQPPAFRARVFADQTRGFAFSGITDEDAATQAIAELLDWLVLHLHRFRIAACTSDTDPWWPQGRNGPFFNVGHQRWQATRTAWVTPTRERPNRPAPVPSHVIFDGLASVRRTFELPHRMALGDIVEVFVEIWEVQQ